MSFRVQGLLHEEGKKRKDLIWKAEWQARGALRWQAERAGGGRGPGGQASPAALLQRQLRAAGLRLSKS